METAGYEINVEEAMKRTRTRCEEFLANNGYLTERDVLLTAYEELHIDPPAYLQPWSTYGYGWLYESVKNNELVASGKDEV